MKSGQWIMLIALLLAATASGWWLGDRGATGGATGEAQPAADGPCPGGAAPSYWKAPMDPSYMRDAPGKSPMGMDLVPVCPSDDKSIGGGGVLIDSQLVQSMGVRIEPVVQRDLSRMVRAVGRVDYDERLVEHVHTKFQGWIEELNVDYEGQMVKKGQPLLEIYSPELVSTQEELLQAASYRQATSQSEFPDVVSGGEALFAASRHRLELWDIPERDIQRLLETDQVQKNVTFYAPATGVVVDLMAREGMEVDSNMRLYTIADLSHVWIYADIYEYELPWIAVGQRGSAALSYLPGKTFEGAVTYVYPFLDPKTRTVRVRLEFPNPGLTLKPGMFANVTIETEVHEDVLAVRAEAIIRSGQRTLAIVSTGDGRFEPRPVVLGIDSGDGWIEVKEGLQANENVVTSGQFLIDSESKLQEAVQKMLSSDSNDASKHEGHDMPAEAGSAPATPEQAMPPSHEGHAEH